MTQSTDLPAAPVPTAILEATLYAEDLDLAEVFYGTLLGLECIQRIGKRHVFFRVGPAVLLIFNPHQTVLPPNNPRLPVPAHGAHGHGHVCFTMDRDAIAAMHDRLAAATVKIDTSFDWPNGARSLYVRDPAGNSVEFAEGWLWGGPG